jgi:ParB family chromosome partitioning protein
VLQAILVREIAAPKTGKAKYQIVAGERRFRAAKLAGLKEIPAQIKSMTDEEALGDQIVENLQREDVHPLDEADGFLRLKEEMKLGVRDIAERVAKDARYVARRLALTNLIEEARDDLRRRAHHARPRPGNLPSRAGDSSRGAGRLLRDEERA